MSAHTPGRLHVGQSNPEIVYDSDGWAVCNATTFHGRHPTSQAENARRLVACWNVCDGLTTEILENIAMLGDTLAGRFKLRDRNEKALTAQRDALLTALQAFLRAPSVGSNGPGSATIVVQDFNLKAARDAIALATPQPPTTPP